MLIRFGENRKSGRGVLQNGNGTGSENFKNDSKDFFQTPFITTFLYVF